MANLAGLVAARNKIKDGGVLGLKRVLIYGQPKSGKTFLAATIAKVPSIKRIFWFDLESGSCTLINPELGLSVEQMQKVEIYSLPDNRQTPIAIETMLKVLSNTGTMAKELPICEEHGRVNCVGCKPKVVVGKGQVTPEVAIFPVLSTLGSEDCIVVDSLSQLGDSAFSAALMLTANDKSAFAKYAEQGRLLSDFLGMLQQLKTNIICVTHVTVNEAEDTKKETVIPLCGTRNFSLKVSKYFSTVIYLSMELKKFKAGSSPDYKLNITAGDRLGVKMEQSASPSMEDLF